MIFEYTNYGDNKRPVIPVILSNHGSYIQYSVLIDSGSDRCFFDAEIGDILGLKYDPDKLCEVMGVGGKISRYYLHKVKLTIQDCSYNIEAGFMSHLGGGIISYGFLGQNGFFDHFEVKFNHNENFVEINKFEV